MYEYRLQNNTYFALQLIPSKKIISLFNNILYNNINT